MAEQLSGKRVLMIGINTLPELTGIGKYSGEMALWLAEQGHECTVVSTFPYYPQWKIQEPYRGNLFKKETLMKGKLAIYRCPLYVPAMPSGLKRVLHEASFFLSAFLVITRLLFKRGHDHIFCVAPPFHLGFLALYYRFFKGGKMIYHIQDLQIEAAKDLKVLKPAWIFTLLFAMERYILKRADHVSTISVGMLKKIRLKCNREIILFPNWTDVEQIFPIGDRAALKPKWGFEQEDKIVLYSGSIGEKQGLEVLINIAEEYKQFGFLKFVICGTGPYKKRLEDMARERGLTNVSFFPLQPGNLFNEFLNLADIHLVLQRGDAADLVLPSKLTTILAAGGLALLTADRGTTLFDIITDNQMGMVVPPDSRAALAEAILTGCKEDTDQYRTNARKFAESSLDKRAVLPAFLNKLSATG